MRRQALRVDPSVDGFLGHLQMGGDLLIPPQASSVAIFDSLQLITVNYSPTEYMKNDFNGQPNHRDAATDTK